MKAFVRQYRLARILSRDEIESMPYMTGRHTPADTDYQSLNNQKAMTLLSAIPADENNPQVALNAVRAHTTDIPWIRKPRRMPSQPITTSENSDPGSEDSDVRISQLQRE